MKILITGASGKIGRELTKYLLKKNIYCYLNMRKKINYKKFDNYEIIQCDILSKNFYIPEDCYGLIHAATVLKKNYNSKSLKKDLIISKKIIQLIKKHKKLKKIIFLSSAEVYNKNFNINKKINEKSHNFNNHLYAKIKLKSENLFNKIKSKHVYNLRIPAIIGTLREDNFLTRLAHNYKKLKKIKLYNSSQFFNNILHINSLNKFILNLLKNNFKSGLILLGSEKPVKLKIISQKIENFFNNSSKVFWLNNQSGFYLDITNSINNFNFKPMSTIKVLNDYLNASFKKL